MKRTLYLLLPMNIVDVVRLENTVRSMGRLIQATASYRSKDHRIVIEWLDGGSEDEANRVLSFISGFASGLGLL